ncbi:MAG: dethiobiotin synthase [Halieaceae bacterium]|jgi:dethiobiotin synthetase|nr:dethiobiotin synthase [Halieaceae bacterium]
MALPSRIFVTGTNTDVGKTVISSILVAGLKSHYWKPIQTGAPEHDDSQWIQRHTGLPGSHFHSETYRFKKPLSPHAAAADEGAHISLDKFELPDTDQQMVVEGAGGILVPLNSQDYMLDLIIRLAIPVLIVADSQLGTINHTLLTLEQLRRSEVEVLGVVLNGPLNNRNRDAIEHYGSIRVLAEIEPLPDFLPATLESCFHRCFNSQCTSN